ncbi:MAG: hypothetical protein IJK98_06265, partial [Clostridia bacterium]|nr:hypothetical protein [Clostridia bacterium]
MKKCLALLLSLLLVTVFFTLSASAADPTITVGSANAAPGETVAIDVSLSNNPGINSFSLGFAYDEALLTLKTVTASPELGGQFTYAKKAVWLNSADSDYNGAILTLTFDTAADAAGTAEVAVTYEEGDIINYDEDDVSFAVVPGKITFQSAECDHQWDAGKVTKAATCKEAGVKTFTCSICKATKTETLPKTKDHKWDAGKVTTAATCTSQGVITYTCSVCKITKTAVIPATGHLWDAGKVTTAATCRSKGVKTYTCTVCKLTKMALIPSTGHVLTTQVTKEATCSSTGLETFVCSFCGATGGTNTIPKNPDNHNGYGTKTVNAKKATATAAGYTGDKVCEGCGAVLEKGKEIPKTGTDEPAENDFRFELKKASLENGVLRVALSWKNGKGLKSGKAFVEYDSAVLKAKSFQWGADARRVYETGEDHDPINIESNPYADDNMTEAGWYFYEVCETNDSFELLFLPFEVLDKTAASTELTL